ncbi:hypothetical protein HDU87_000768 [Geranomyces variabilis]|uniref:Uncharacterized protein n=1 Tax=Geranomyces variabilis TaxID=109894 RepID=A0AAD5TN83_9FUNG|nr:hypothetical protein HDU87_000768 [Geranomyces variabilis]
MDDSHPRLSSANAASGWRRFLTLKRSKSASGSSSAPAVRKNSSASSAKQWASTPSSPAASPKRPTTGRSFPDMFSQPRRSQSSTAINYLAQMPPPPSLNNYHQYHQPSSPLVALTSRQLADLASCVVERLDMHDYRTAVPASAMQAARALASTNRSDTASLSSSTVAEAHDKIRGLLPAQLHRLAMDVEMECERRFPDLAVSVQSLQQAAGHNGYGLETLERGGRTFLSLPRKSGGGGEFSSSRSTMIPMRSSSPQMPPPSVFRDVPTPLTTRHSLSRSRSRSNRRAPFPSLEYETPASSPPLVTAAFSQAAEQPAYGINGQQPGSPVSYTSNRYSAKAAPAAEPGIISAAAAAAFPFPALSAPASPSKLSVSAASSSPGTPASADASASANYTHEEFVAGLASLTTSQLVAAVRDVQAVISRQQRLDHKPDTLSPRPPRPPSPSLDESGGSPLSALSKRDSDSSVTHCQNLLLQLPATRVKLIWTAVAEEVRRRGLNVNVL